MATYKSCFTLVILLIKDSKIYLAVNIYLSEIFFHYVLFHWLSNKFNVKSVNAADDMRTR